MWARHSPETIEAVAKLASSGLSGAKIAAQLGITRNAAVGLAFRNGIKLDGAPAGGRPKRKDPVVVIKEIPPNLIPFDELKPESCRYPYGDQNFMFCGDQKLENHSWCGRHCAVVFQPRMR